MQSKASTSKDNHPDEYIYHAYYVGDIWRDRYWYQPDAAALRWRTQTSTYRKFDNSWISAEEIVAGGPACI